MVCWAWKFNKLSSHTHLVIFWNHLGPQIITLLNGLNNKTEKQKEKDSKKRKRKRPGACSQNSPGRLPQRAVATARARSPQPARPLPRPRVDKEAPKLLSMRPRFSPCLARSLLRERRRYAETLTHLPMWPNGYVLPFNIICMHP